MYLRQLKLSRYEKLFLCFNFRIQLIALIFLSTVFSTFILFLGILTLMFLLLSYWTQEVRLNGLIELEKETWVKESGICCI